MKGLISMSTGSETKTREVAEIVYSAEEVYGKKVILYNDNHNSFDHVEFCLMKICFKTQDQARKIALEAHTKGKAVCYRGSFEECETVAEKMAEEDLTVSLES